MKRLFSHDALTGVSEVFHGFDDGSFAIETIENEVPLLESNRQQFNQFTSGRDRWGDDLNERTKVASLSVTKTQELRAKGILQDPVRLAVWLNSADAAPYRTRPGSVGVTGKHT